MYNIVCINIREQIRSARQQLGMSQGSLGHLSQTSLPTVQNIEMGKGNPTLHVLSALATVLGLEVSLAPRKPDWNYLIHCGLPLEASEAGGKTFALSQLVTELVLATRDKLTERERDAISAFLIAIQLHYPSTYRKHFAKVAALSKLVPAHPTGRLIKLSRMARERLSKFL